jgi:cardiolipin synthase
MRLPLIEAAQHPHEKYRELARTALAVTGRPLLKGNSIRVLHNGNEAYPAMLAAIGDATSSINLSTYIFDSDESGRAFVDALGAAHARGVTVRVLTDGIGEFYSRPRITPLLRAQGVPAARFLPPGLNRPIHINLRNHRKILVVDGRHGFTGGMNIGDRHVSRDGRPPKAVDMHFGVEGPVVSQLETVFLEDWAFATGETVDPTKVDDWTTAGPSLCRGISDGPNEDYEKFEWVLIGAVNCAQHRVRIMTPYFLPGPELSAALSSAALRGVDVEVILPAKNNLPFVAWATQSMLWQVVQHGVRVYYQPPPFTHSKLFVVDDHYAQIGSANLDPRSLTLNFEFNVEVYCDRFGDMLTRHFEQTSAKSRPVRLDELHGRPLPVKLRDAAFWIFSPYL